MNSTADQCVVASRPSSRPASASTTVPVQTDIGRAILLAGGQDSNQDVFWPTSNYLGNLAYTALQKRRFPKEKVFYLNDRQEQDVDWTFFSPAMLIFEGERKGPGSFRLGGEELARVGIGGSQALAQLVEASPAAPGPAQRQFHRRPRLLFRRRIGRALVEDHRHVGVQVVLHLYRTLGRQLDGVAVDRRLEADALLAELAELGQREDLEAAAVGDQRPLPAHELVQAAELGHQLLAGVQQTVAVHVIGQEQGLAECRVVVAEAGLRAGVALAVAVQVFLYLVSYGVVSL